MPSLKNVPDWVKSIATVAVTCVVTVFAMGYKDGERQARAAAVEETVKGHEPRIAALERSEAGNVEWRTFVRETLTEIKAALVARPPK